jgi:hypothetical protein
MSFGASLDNHREAPPSYLPDADPGRHGGGTYTGHSVEPTLEAYENIFGPSARDIKQDLQRFKRHGRWHLPDILKGPNQYLTDRIDGLITDATSSPFTSRILPYKYITNVDGKIKWNVWSFDEGLASRVPYESAARTLTQTKRSYAGYFIRQGMAIVLEHNFMMTEAGRQNFKNQLNQLVGSIQLTNDLDVHVALVLAPSYQKTMNERYLTQDKSAAQICREFVELFGFVQKNQNALDILIEEAKSQLRTWGAPMPDFMLCNSKLTFQLTMTPDVTNYVTQGPEGQKKLKTGPNLSSYRGIGIVHTRAFSMETGAPPRDMLRRRVRTAEYYRICPHKENHKRAFQLYNEERDTWATFTFQDLLKMAQCDASNTPDAGVGPGSSNWERIMQTWTGLTSKHPALPGPGAAHLGEVMPSTFGNLNKRTAELTGLFDRLLSKDFTPLFKWDPEHIAADIVYVPGALDVKENLVYIQQNINAFANSLPEYIKKAVKTFLDSYSNSSLIQVDQENMIKTLIQSVAPYHRNLLATQFLDKIIEYESNGTGVLSDSIMSWEKGGVTKMKTIVDDFQSSYDTARLNHKNDWVLYERTALRNYLRFGVPEKLFRRKAVSSEDNNRPLKEIFNFSENLKDMSLLDCKLRNKGAWFCPNHYKDPNLKFNNIGDFIGYHALLTQEMVNSFCLNEKTEKDQQNSFTTFSEGTLLFDIIMNQSAYDKLYDEVFKILKDFNESPDMGKPKTRVELSAFVLLKIVTVLLNHNGLFDKGFRYANYYWLLPRTESCNEEIYSANARDPSQGMAHQQWKHDLWELKSGATNVFQQSLTIDNTVCAVMATDKTLVDSTDDNSPNWSVQLPSKFPTVTRDHVANFFKMLAWRLWADQEVPLSRVYTFATGRWPDLDNIITPPVDFVKGAFGSSIFAYNFPGGAPDPMTQHEIAMAQEVSNVEIVIVRPNIEHYMMGIILGQGGESLGSTFWGQTELSCYDDSMHGIWGMSYKYHERAIVINERNLIRLWDIAYDGYVGGKDDTAVQWDVPENGRDSVKTFNEATMDVTRPYRGPSMMVMAFHHGDAKNAPSIGEYGRSDSLYKTQYSSNWPSPIVFYDRLNNDSQIAARADFDNLHAVEVAPFRVFNSDLYKNAYKPYRDKMPNFWELHTIRKNAGLAATENEVSSDALAFQGTMRVLSADTGAVIQEVLGSGHHGPDFIGVASLRAGKGYRLNSQPTVHRLV